MSKKTNTGKSAAGKKPNTGGKGAGGAGSGAGRKTNTGGASLSRKVNAFTRSLGLRDFGVTDVLGVVGGALTASIVSDLIPFATTPGSWPRIIKDGAIAYGVNRFAPRQVRTSATAGALVSPSLALADKLVPNAKQKISNLLPSWGGGADATQAAALSGLMPVQARITNAGMSPYPQVY